MRPTNSSSPGYQPGEPPNDPAQIPRYLRELEIKLKAAIDAVAEGFAPVVYAYPPKPRAGMLRNFDSSVAGLSSGAGLYRFNGAAWVFLG